MLLGKAICSRFDLNEDLALDTYRLTRAAGLPTTHFSHDFSSLLAGFPYNYYPSNKSAYKNKKVIFLSRNIKDVLVSSYFQATRRINKFDGTLSEFVRHDVYGARKIITFYNSWSENQHLPFKFQHLRYEEMHANTATALQQVLRFMDFPDPADEIIETAVAYATFQNMKKMEKQGVIQNGRLQPGNPDDAESFKVRRGVVAGYQEYLSPDDIAFIDQKIMQYGGAFAQESLNF